MKSRRKSIIRKSRKSRSIKRKVNRKSKSIKTKSKMNMPPVSNNKELFAKIKKKMILNSLHNTANTDCFNGYPTMYYKRLDYYTPLLGYKKANDIYDNCIEKAFSNPKFTEEDKKDILRKVYRRYDIPRTNKEYKEFIDTEYDFYKNVLPKLKHVPNFPL